MENICPLCNGLYSKIEKCPVCNQQLADSGKLEDYLGPYSPYQDEDLYMWQQEIEHPELGDDYCVHILICSNCSYHNRLAIPLLSI